MEPFFTGSTHPPFRVGRQADYFSTQVITWHRLPSHESQEKRCSNSFPHRSQKTSPSLSHRLSWTQGRTSSAICVCITYPSFPFRALSFQLHLYGNMRLPGNNPAYRFYPHHAPGKPGRSGYPLSVYQTFPSIPLASCSLRFSLSPSYVFCLPYPVATSP